MTGVSGWRLDDVARGAPVEATVDGRPLSAFDGETIAAALLAAGIRAFRRTPGGAPRGPLCGMGICFDCVVVVDGRPNVRACVTPIRPGMAIRTGTP